MTERPLAPTSDASSGLLYPLAVALLVLGLLFGFAFLPRLFRGHAGVTEGNVAPTFSLPVVANAPAAGQTALGTNDLKGKAVILDFWATWCGPCRAQSPILDGLAQRYADRGLVVVGVDTNDGDGNAQAWVKSHGITYPIVTDDHVTSDAYGVQNLPTLVVLSREGKVVATRVGLTDAAELEAILKQVL